MIVRWTAGALADLRLLENYQRRHWPESRATSSVALLNFR